MKLFSIVSTVSMLFEELLLDKSGNGFKIVLGLEVEDDGDGCDIGNSGIGLGVTGFDGR